MSRRPKSMAVALVAAFVLVVGPAAVLGQADTAPSDSGVADLAVLDAPRFGALMCEEAGALLTDDGHCRLGEEAPKRPLLDSVFKKPVDWSFLVDMAPPQQLSGEPREDLVAVERVTFSERVSVDKKARKKLGKAARRKGRKTVSGKKLNPKIVGVIDIALAPETDSLRHFPGDWLVRVRNGERIHDFGVRRGKDYVVDENGRKLAGLAVVDDAAVSLVIPGGLRGDFTVDLVHVNKDGSVSGQHLGGPGSANAGIPADGDWSPLLHCAEFSADIDFDSSTDGRKYGLLGLDLRMETAVLPPFATGADVTADLTLTPRGSRAKAADEIVLTGLPASGDIREAIALEIDLSQESLQGDSGYWLRERPFDIKRMTLNLDTDAIASFDPDAAAELLAEAGWIDADADGTYTRKSADLVDELQRFVGGDHTSRPLFYGDPACGGDAHFLSVEDVCQLPEEAGLQVWSDRLAEDIEDLILQPGLFPGDLYGCTVLGPESQLLSVFAVSPAYGDGGAFDQAWIDWADQIECSALSALPPVGSDTPSKVADCAGSDFEIWAHDGIGAWAYALLPGASISASEARTFIDTFAARDADADGISDRHDTDLDGDGIADVDDRDDDGDGATDDLDFTVRSDATFLSPGATAKLAELAELLQRGR